MNQYFDITYTTKHRPKKVHKNRSSDFIIWTNISSWMCGECRNYEYETYTINGTEIVPETWRATLLIMGITDPEPMTTHEGKPR